MRNLITRTILWLVAVPALVAIILLLPFYHQLALNAIVIVVSAIGAAELAELFERRDAGYRASFVTIPILGAAFPLIEYLVASGLLPPDSRHFAVYAIAAIVLFLQIVRREDEGFRHTLTNTAANITVMLYPGLFLSYLVRLSTFDHAGAVILTFLCSVIFNDTMAYLAGIFYRFIRERSARKRGKEWSPRFVLPVSPKKTIVGFITGTIMAPVTIVLAHLIAPEAIPGTTWRLIGIGVAVGAATVIGDLIESALKRSATKKDSGSLIPGRGGILDSIDSVLYAAPVFFYLLPYAL